MTEKTKVKFEPKPGDFELVPVGGESGKLIRFGQWLNGEGFSDIEHARLYLGDGKCIQAQPGGADIVEYDPNDDGVWSTDIIELTDEQRWLICMAGRRFEGVGYSVMDYFALAAYRLKFGLLIPGLRKYVASSKHVICSQLVDKAYQEGGVQLFDDKRWNGYVTPASLLNLLKKLSKKVIIVNRRSRGKHAL